MARLIFSERAELDLIEIGNFIAADNPAAARRFVAHIEKHCRLLEDHPLLGRSRDDLLPELRSLPYRRYVIFYRVSGDSVQIVRVLHGARDAGCTLR
jgi:toxin ParE1/3/4